MATLDILTLADAKLAIANNAGTGNDTLLASAITGISQYLDELCGPVVVRTITDEVQDGGDPVVLLKWRPVSSVTTVTEWDGSTSRTLTKETFGTAPAEGYSHDLGAGMLYRRKSGLDAAFACGRQNVKVTYEAGRYADTASVAERFKRACGIVLKTYWSREHGGASGAAAAYAPIPGMPYGLPGAALDLICRDLRAEL